MRRRTGWASTVAAFRVALPLLSIIVSPLIAAPQAGDRRGARRTAPLATRKLEPGGHVDYELSRGRTERFSVHLDANQSLHVDLTPHGVAVAVDLVDPAGRTLRKIRSPYPSEGPMSVWLTAPLPGAYVLAVSATDTGGLTGQVTVELASVRTGTGDDRSRSDAQQKLCEGLRLRDRGTSDALQSAIADYKRALELWPADDATGRADTLVAMALAYYDRGDNQESLDVASQALAAFRALGDQRGEGAALDVMGEAADAMGDERGALSHYQQALTLRKAVGDRLAEAETLNNIGVAYDSLGEKRHALQYFEESLALKHALHLPQREGTSLNNVGWVLFTLGDMQAALARYREALPLRKAEGDLNGQSVTLTNIGSVYLTLGDAKTAMEYYAQALRLADRVGNNVWAGTLTNNMGFALFGSGDVRNAIVSYKTSLDLRRAAHDRAGEAVTLNNLARTYGELGDVDQEQDHYTRALEMIRSVGDQRWEANILNNIGRSLLTRGESAEAATRFEEAVRLARTVGDLRAEAVAMFGGARVAAERGDLTEAQSKVEPVLPLVESLRSRVASPNLRASYFATLREPYDFSVDAFMRMHEQNPTKGFDKAALELVERGRGRMLLEALGESRAAVRAGADPQLLEQERSLRELIEGKRDVQVTLLGGPHADAEVLAIKQELDELLIRQHELEAEIQSTSPHYAALTQPPVLDTGEIQRLLDQDTLLLSFALGDPRSYVWAVTRDRVSSIRLSRQQDINEAARRVYGLLTEGNRMPGEATGQWQRRWERAEAAYPEAAAHLSQLILGPVAGLLGNKRLVIVSDGALHYVPFGALPDPQVAKGVAAADSSAHQLPLIATHEIVRLPSASVLAVLRREASQHQAAPNGVAVLADPVFERHDPRVTGASAPMPRGRERSPSSPRVPSDDASRERLQRSAAEMGPTPNGLRFRRLPFTRMEAKAILDLVPPGTSRMAFDFEASRATALDSSLSQYRIVHFATHGLVTNEHPELSGLVLSLVDEQGKPQNGFLDLEDVYNLKLNADLVVLSACESAVGKEIKGEGLIALARGFMHAGAPRVVASLWKVEDSATAELMQRFYAKMLRVGKTPAAALRDAQVEMWQQRRWSSPYFWSGFEIQGDWR
jgi:CHAT domain-containing protein/tetratricopeptide (TPR) repeat protein